MITFILVIVLGYLAGSFPTSYLAGRIFRDIDIRKYGSGNIGATNVFRVLGPGPGIIVLLIDVLKGWLPVFVFVPLLASRAGMETLDGWLKISAGLSAVCGHNWTVFLRFRGGKGVATSAGVLLGIVPKPLGLSAAVWLIVAGSTMYVSLGSIISALSLPVFIWLSGEQPEIIGFGIIVTVFIIIRHRQNIIRLLQHRENKLRFGGRA